MNFLEGRGKKRQNVE